MQTIPPPAPTLFKTPSSDDRYNGHVYDNRLGIRANVDVNITESTAMKVGVMARLSESNKPYYMRSSNAIEKLLYKIPSAAFPIKHADGTYGGSSIYGNSNPVACQLHATQERKLRLHFLPQQVLRQTRNRQRRHHVRNPPNNVKLLGIKF